MFLAMHAWVTEFIQLLSSEANEVATKEKRNMIQPEHVMSALRELGFSEFIPEVTLVRKTGGRGGVNMLQQCPTVSEGESFTPAAGLP